MGFFRNFLDSMRISPDAEDDYYDEEEYEERPARTIFNRQSRIEEEEEISENKPRIFSRNKPVTTKKNMEVALVKPTSVEDSRSISDYLLAGKAVVLNMEGIHTDLAQRIIDFTSGATYSLDGKLQKISNYIFIATPNSIDLSGDFQDLLNTSSSFDVTGFNMRI